jgi:hypothetical protein
MTLNRAALSAVKKELHGCDTPISLTVTNVLSTTTTNGASFCLNLIQQGTGSWNRIGRKITMKNLRIKTVALCSHFNDGTTGDIAGNRLRIVVVWDAQPSSGTIPTFQSIFAITDQQGTETGNIFDSVRFDNTGRFRVLSDKVIVSNPMASGPANGDFTQVYHFCDDYIKLPNLQAIYSATNDPSTIADISTGAIYVYYRASTNVSTTSYMGS